MPNIYQHIQKNKEDTYLVMLGFIIVVSLIAWVIGQFYGEGSGTVFLGWALVFSGITSFVSYYNSDKIVLSISQAQPVVHDQYPQLYDLVENVCIGAGLPVPRIYVIQDTAMNAFATGRDPNHSVICFTTGIIDTLEKRELEGVVAHELSHIGNYDTRLMSIVSILVGTITLISDGFTRGRFYSGGRRDRSEAGGLILLLGLLLVILSPIIATLIKLAISRKREYLADSTAALITRYPQGLADALKKLAGDREILEAANGATAHLYITNPLKNEFGGFMANLFNTHPPISERVKRLESM